MDAMDAMVLRDQVSWSAAFLSGYMPTFVRSGQVSPLQQPSSIVWLLVAALIKRALIGDPTETTIYGTILHQP